MNVMRILRGKLKDGDALGTPVQDKKFKIEHISEVEVRLVMGKGRRTTIPANCLNGIPNFLRNKDWVEIGTKHYYSNKLDTLEHYITSFQPVKAGIANYIASILERAGIVDIDRERPSQVRLRNNNKFI